MKFAESWLREWVDPPFDAAAIAERLTLAGHEVDGIHAEGAGLDGVVVAEILGAEPHPNADRLQVCRVSTGAGDPITIVCGAPNARVGLKSPLAPAGTRLPNGMKLRRSKIRGVESNGMLCSAVELGLGEEADGIVELPVEAAVGQSLGDCLRLPDKVFDVDLTPNRGDCFSVQGIARDLSALTGAPLAGPELSAVEATCDASHPVELVDAAACPRFAGRVVRGIDSAARTPLWMTERLRRSGIRAIHPVVDVTNYVMLELGQPLHAYDLARLRGPVRPRFARTGETVTLLDERQVELDDSTVVVTDDSGPIGLAGIMGGLGTAVTGSTTDVFFEAAFWPQAIMAGRARSYGLHTDASMRFERGVDPRLQAHAIERATALLLAIGGGEAGPLVDLHHDDALPKRPAVPLRRTRLRALLGITIDDDEVARILRSLALTVSVNTDGWMVTPPGFRFDIVLEEDLIEEVARVYGYDRISESSAIVATPLDALTETRVDLNVVADMLVARDYQEVITYSFVDAAVDRLLMGSQSHLELANPISSEMAVMRGTLWSGLLPTAIGNLSRQQDRVRLFETGKSFHGTADAPREVLRLAGLALGPRLPEQWSGDAQDVDFYDLKADVDALLARTGSDDEVRYEALEHVALQPGQAARIMRRDRIIGVIGKLHPAATKALDLRKNVYLFELDADAAFAAKLPSASAVSRFPAVRRDVAILVRDEVTVAQIRAATETAVSDILRDVRVFDVYRGPGIEAGLKSVALGLILQGTSRTLTDADADSATLAAVQELQRKFAAVLRD